MISQPYYIVNSKGPVALASTTNATGWISLKNVQRMTAIINIQNSSVATVTGTTVSLLQATAVAGTSSKTLSFSTYYANVDQSAGNALTPTTATSDVFTTATTLSKNLMYAIEITPEMLDTANSFDCVNVIVTGAVASVGCICYILEPRYAQKTALSVIAD